MFNDNDHIIHLVDGQLAPRSKTSAQHVRDLVAKALASQPRSGVVVHFHGGLVSEKSARDTIQNRLHPHYTDRSGGYPVYFVWESGLLEAPLNNLREIANEALFREFVKKASEWLLRTLPAAAGLKGATGAAVAADPLRHELDEWFAGRRDEPPAQLQLRPGGSGAELAVATRGVEPDEEALAAEIELSIDGDDSFRTAVQEVANGLHDGTPRPSTRGTGTTVAATSLVSKEAAAELFPSPAGVATKGFGPVAWFNVAKKVAGIVLRVVRRLRKGRGHGVYVTVVEEVLRALYVDKLGRAGWWERMKTDTADAFRRGDAYGGTVFLAELARQTEGKTPPRITLVGHSTGAIYICHLLRAAAELAPSLEFDVVFLAPAATHRLFAATLAEHGSRIRRFRQFGMDDSREAGDNLVPIIYPASLLYFVSGMLEGEPDEPLTGMARYTLDEDVYGADDFASVAACRAFYRAAPGRLSWSPCTEPEGMLCDSRKHGDFDDRDPTTLTSVQHILEREFA